MHAVQINFADQDATLVGRRALPADTYKYYVEYAAAGDDGRWVAIPELDMYNDFDIMSDHLCGIVALCATPYAPCGVLHVVTMPIRC